MDLVPLSFVFFNDTLGTFIVGSDEECQEKRGAISSPASVRTPGNWQDNGRQTPCECTLVACIYG